MPALHITTFIKAPVERVFDLSRSIELHKISMRHTGEQTISGITTGLMKAGDQVLWEARHLGKTRRMKVLMQELEPYSYFKDIMQEGDFRFMEHHHYFRPCENGTIMIDVFNFETPYGVAGKLLNAIYLTAYMKKLLLRRNQTIIEYAEQDQKWKSILDTGAKNIETPVMHNA